MHKCFPNAPAALPLALVQRCQEALHVVVCMLFQRMCLPLDCCSLHVAAQKMMPAQLHHVETDHSKNLTQCSFSDGHKKGPFVGLRDVFSNRMKNKSNRRRVSVV